MNKKTVKWISFLIPVSKWRKSFRKSFVYPPHPSFVYADSFKYGNKIIKLMEHSFNCGTLNGRMTERALELAIAVEWAKTLTGKVFEVGAVMPYYDLLTPEHICDPYDPHPSVDYHCSLFDLDFTGKNVLSISTLEHVSTGDYGLEIEDKGAIDAVKKVLKEADNCLITIPVGYNPLLDNYFASYNNDLDVFGQTVITLYKRNTVDNNWEIVENLAEIKNIKYGPNAANGVLIIEKKLVRE